MVFCISSGVVSLSSVLIKSFKTSFVKSMVISRPIREEKAVSLVNRPSSSLIFDVTLLASKKATSFVREMFFSNAFFFKIATRVSVSGGCMSAISPHWKRDRILSSSLLISLGLVSLVTTICFFNSKRELKVWKNSSWVLSLPAINCMSSSNKTSIFLYLFLKSSILLYRIELMSSLVNCSEVT